MGGLMRTGRSSMRVAGRFCTVSSWRKTGKKSLKNLVNMLKLNCQNGLERGQVKRQEHLTLLKMRMNFLQKLLLLMMMKSQKRRRRRKKKKKRRRKNNDLEEIKSPVIIILYLLSKLVVTNLLYCTLAHILQYTPGIQ